MKKPEPFQLTIPKPCQENWEEMTPTQGGNFCGSCQKTVIDFTRFTNSEILLYFNENQGKAVCGRLREDQQRFHYPTKVSRPVRWWPLILGSFFGSIYSGYSSEKPGFSIAKPYETEPQTTEEKKLLPKNTGIEIKGRLLESVENEPIPFASIFLLGHSLRTSSDFEGKFTLNVPDSLSKDSIHLKISMVGYSSIFLHLSSSEASSFLRLVLSRNEEFITKGTVVTTSYENRYPSFWRRITSIFRRKKHPIEAQ